MMKLTGTALVAAALLFASTPSQAAEHNIKISPKDAVDLTQLRDELIATIKAVGAYYIYQKADSAASCDIALYAVPSKIKLSYKRATNVDFTGGVAIPIAIISPTLKGDHKKITTVATDVTYDIDWPKGGSAKNTLSPENALYAAQHAPTVHEKNVGAVRYLVENMLQSNVAGNHTKPCIAKLGSVPFTTSFQVNNSGGIGLSFFGISLGASKELDTTQTIEIDYDFTKKDIISILTSEGLKNVPAASKPLSFKVKQ